MLSEHLRFFLIINEDRTINQVLLITMLVTVFSVPHNYFRMYDWLSVLNCSFCFHIVNIMRHYQIYHMS